MAFSYSKALDGESKDIALVRISRRNGIPLSTQIADATLETYSLRPRSALVKVFRCGPWREGGAWRAGGPRWQTSQGGSRGGLALPMGKEC